MIKILAIGNSFSQDATAYLYDIAKGGNIDIKVVNLYIGGCSLRRHWENIQTEEAAYDYELNGRYTGRKISMKEALTEENWDYITLQQVSNDSGLINTYYPYIKDIHQYVEQLVPAAKVFLHQTWAYELDSTHQAFRNYQNNQSLMYRSLISAYQQVSNDLRLNTIPCGTVIQELRKTPEFDYANGGSSLCRDGFHMSLDYGRYTVAAVWYEYLLKANISGSSFLLPEINGEPIDSKKIRVIQETVHKIVSEELRFDNR